jgi:hypothetical protein
MKRRRFVRKKKLDHQEARQQQIRFVAAGFPTLTGIHYC